MTLLGNLFEMFISWSVKVLLFTPLTGPSRHVFDILPVSIPTLRSPFGILAIFPFPHQTPRVLETLGVFPHQTPRVSGVFPFVSLPGAAGEVWCIDAVGESLITHF
jgi:hypothetical protein